MAKNKKKNGGKKSFVQWCKSPLGIAIVPILLGALAGAFFTNGFGIPALIREWLEERARVSAELNAIPDEIRQRLAWAKTPLDEGRPNAAKLILNSKDSNYVANHKYINKPLSLLLTDLKSLGYDWRGADPNEFIRLAMSNSEEDLAKLVTGLEAVFLPTKPATPKPPIDEQSYHPIFDFDLSET